MNSGFKKQRLANKKPSHRRALLHSQLLELIRAEHLQTTSARAKYLKQNFDKLVTKAKKSTDASKRNVASILQNDKAVTKLFDKLLPRLQDRNSGYTTSARTLPRKGDNASQIIVMIHGYEVEESKSRLSKLLNRETAASKPKAPRAKKVKETK